MHSYKTGCRVSAKDSISYQCLCFQWVDVKLSGCIVRRNDISQRSSTQTDIVVRTPHLKQQCGPFWTTQSTTFQFTLQSNIPMKLVDLIHRMVSFTFYIGNIVAFMHVPHIYRCEMHAFVVRKLQKRKIKVMSTNKPVKTIFVGKPCGGEPMIMSVPCSFSYKTASNCLPCTSTHSI